MTGMGDRTGRDELAAAKRRLCTGCGWRVLFGLRPLKNCPKCPPSLNNPDTALNGWPSGWKW